MNPSTSSLEFATYSDSEQLSTTACIICGQEHDRSFLQTLEKDLRPRKKRHSIKTSLVVLVPLILIGIIVAGPNPMIRVRQLREREAANNLRTIGQAEASFHQDNGRYGTFADLVTANELTAEWREFIVRGGYRFSIKLYPSSVAIYAWPDEYGGETRKSFQLRVIYSDKGEDFQLHGADRFGEKATRLDSIIDR